MMSSPIALFPHPILWFFCTVPFPLFFSCVFLLLSFHPSCTSLQLMLLALQRASSPTKVVVFFCLVSISWMILHLEIFSDLACVFLSFFFFFGACMEVWDTNYIKSIGLLIWCFGGSGWERNSNLVIWNSYSYSLCIFIWFRYCNNHNFTPKDCSKKMI